ncbi:hypothetical protein [Dermacoccus nishinomiyaensis]|uniref:hypothetical protein n=1 Tax=Dermacoccus nishinomiyaensis TaxID=1274 RepID=UPI001EF44667|nr:hypothetical protein [Dermacoccus nishinomiyaensis]MCG7430641.1 hypothetical protein [Dermacoccus nishinomiyaensis]
MYIIISYALGIVLAVMALSGISQGNGGGAIVCALLAAVFIWGGRTEQVKRQKLQAEHAHLTAEREARR